MRITSISSQGFTPIMSFLPGRTRPDLRRAFLAWNLSAYLKWHQLESVCGKTWRTTSP